MICFNTVFLCCKKSFSASDSTVGDKVTVPLAHHILFYISWQLWDYDDVIESSCLHSTWILYFFPDVWFKPAYLFSLNGFKVSVWIFIYFSVSKKTYRREWNGSKELEEKWQIVHSIYSQGFHWWGLLCSIFFLLSSEKRLLWGWEHLCVLCFSSLTCLGKTEIKSNFHWEKKNTVY